MTVSYIGILAFSAERRDQALQGEEERKHSQVRNQGSRGARHFVGFVQIQREPAKVVCRLLL